MKGPKEKVYKFNKVDHDIVREKIAQGFIRDYRGMYRFYLAVINFPPATIKTISRELLYKENTVAQMISNLRKLKLDLVEVIK
jgi:uncharacterized protein (DUF39 family)